MAGGRRLLGPGLVAFQAHYRDLPAGRLDEALANVDAGVSALDEPPTCSTGCRTCSSSKMAVHEARGELDRALLTFEDLLEAARREPGSPATSGPVRGWRRATMLAQLGRPEEARVQLERVDAEWSSWAGCDSQVARAVIAARSAAPAEALGHARRGLQEAERMPPFDRVRVGSVARPGALRRRRGGRWPGWRSSECSRHSTPGSRPRGRGRRSPACCIAPVGRPKPMTPSPPPSPRPASGAASSSAASGPASSRCFGEPSSRAPSTPTTAIAAIEAAFPGGPEVLGFADHPDPAVRERALLAAAAAGHPEALSRAAGSEGDRSRGGSFEARRPGGEDAGRLRGATGVVAARRFRLGAQGRRADRQDALVRGGRVRPRGRAVRGVLARQALRHPPAEGCRPRSRALARRSTCRGRRAACRAAGAPTRSSSRERDRLDARAFEARPPRGLAAEGPERIARLEAAARIWTGEPLPEERYSDWAASWRARLSSFRADVLSALVERARRPWRSRVRGQGRAGSRRPRPARRALPADPDRRVRGCRPARRRPAPVPGVPTRPGRGARHRARRGDARAAPARPRRVVRAPGVRIA